MGKSPYQQGYDAGYRKQPVNHFNVRDCEIAEYNKGYREGKADKEFSDAYSDEAFGIYGGFDG